jgi:hypothetical protein
MQYTIGVDDEFLHVKVSGRSEDRPPSEVCAAILGESERLGCRRILIELDQHAPLSATSQYQLVTRLPELGFTPEHRIALVHRTPEMQRANEFINVVAANRDLNVQNFPAVDAAKAWLRQ